MRLPFCPALLRVPLGACAALVLAGCQLGAPRQQPGTPGGAPVAPPAPLSSLQSNAETMIDSADAGDWNRVSAELAAIHQAWTSLRPDLAGRGARAGLLDSADAAIAALDRQANRLSRSGTASAANHLTAFVPDMLAVYGTTVPPQIAQMRYLARQVGSAAPSGQMPLVWDDARALGSAWAYIRPAAQRVGAYDASRLDLQLAELDAAVAQATGGQRAMPALALPAAAPVSGASGSAASASSAAASVSTPSSSSPSGTQPPTSSSASSAPSAARSSSAAAPPSRRRSNPAPSFEVSPADSIAPAAAAILDTLDALARDFQTPQG